MKKTIAILFLLSTQLLATEIQCKTDDANLDIVVKKSHPSNNYYVLFFEGDRVSPIPLSSNLVNDTESSFSYKDDFLSIDIQLKSQQGTVLINDVSSFILHDCKNTDSPE